MGGGKKRKSEWGRKIRQMWEREEEKIGERHFILLAPFIFPKYHQPKVGPFLASPESLARFCPVADNRRRQLPQLGLSTERKHQGEPPPRPARKDTKGQEAPPCLEALRRSELTQLAGQSSPDTVGSALSCRPAAWLHSAEPVLG